MTAATIRAHVLAGDVGGTKTNLAVYAAAADRGRRVVREASYPSTHYTALETVVAKFARHGIITHVVSSFRTV